MWISVCPITCCDKADDRLFNEDTFHATAFATVTISIKIYLPINKYTVCTALSVCTAFKEDTFQ